MITIMIMMTIINIMIVIIIIIILIIIIVVVSENLCSRCHEQIVCHCLLSSPVDYTRHTLGNNVLEGGGSSMETWILVQKIIPSTPWLWWHYESI